MIKNLNCLIVGKGHPRWKGDSASYSAKHKWITKHFGISKICEDCGTTTAKKYHWANLSGKHLRERCDYKRLCVLCHKKFDFKLCARGEKSGLAKLKLRDVEDIRYLLKTGRNSHRDISLLFGVSKSAITAISTGKSWNMKD